MSTEAFNPQDVATASINISGSSQRVLVGTFPAGVKVPVRICNVGSATVWIRAGDSSVTATTSYLPIPGNGFTEVLRFEAPIDGRIYIAGIAAAATGYIYFTPGIGI